jgi:hypothetical protein
MSRLAMYMCDCCRRLTDLSYYKRRDQYLCEECLWDAQVEDSKAPDEEYYEEHTEDE